jgi:hypothetical protein
MKACFRVSSFSPRFGCSFCDALWVFTMGSTGAIMAPCVRARRDRLCGKLPGTRARGGEGETNSRGGFEDASTELEKTQADGGKLGGGENARPGDRVPYCQHKPIGGSGQDQPHIGERRTATGSVGGELGLVHLDQVRPARPQRLSRTAARDAGLRSGLRYARSRPALTLPITEAEPEAPIANTVKSGSPFRVASRRLAKDRDGFSSSGFTVPWNMTYRGRCEG